MVEKLKKIKTKQIVMFSVLAFMLVLVVGTTYAYFTSKKTLVLMKQKTLKYMQE